MRPPGATFSQGHLFVNGQPDRDIAEDLKQRIAAGEFSPGDQLPAITSLMEHYNVPGLNTIRQAQQLLVDDGLIETRQGVGAFVLRSEPIPRPVDLLAELSAARAALNRAIAALEKAGAAHQLRLAGPVSGR